MLKFALRILWKNRLFSLLNVVGLTFGLAATIWLVMFLQNELTFDQHFNNHERIYRVSHVLSAPGVEFNTAYSASELMPKMKEELPPASRMLKRLSWAAKSRGSVEHLHDCNVFEKGTSPLPMEGCLAPCFLLQLSIRHNLLF